MHLNSNLVELYQKQGFLVVPDLIEQDRIQELKKETIAIFRGDRGKIAGLIEASEGASDEEILRKYVAIHFPHKLSNYLYEFLFQKEIIEVLSEIVSPNLKCMQSMLFVKAPGKKGQAWHQDEYYIPTRDKSLIGAWIAIDDANIENGCLWIIPGSHKPGFLERRITSQNDEYADVDTIDVTRFPKEELVPVEVKAGSVIFFNGYTLHSSLRNRSAGSFRMALVNHYMSAESLLPWDQDGKLPLTEDLRDIVLVAGKDPYEWKGVTNVNRPFLRPDILDFKAIKDNHES